MTDQEIVIEYLHNNGHKKFTSQVLSTDKVGVHVPVIDVIMKCIKHLNKVKNEIQ